MESPFELDRERYQPPTDYVYARNPTLRFDQRRLARVVGVIAFGLPIVLGLGGVVLGEFRDALSGYYYEEIILGDFFVGSLVAIGSLLFAYRGWTPKVAQLATLAGVAALLVAFVPMDGWVVGCTEISPAGTCAEETKLYPKIGYWVHAGAAGCLFAILAFFCFFVFTKVPMDDDLRPEEVTPAKKRRNAIYIASGFIIAICSISIGAGDLLFGETWNGLKLTFWAEAAILGAFGASWLTHGRVFAPLRDPQDEEDAREAERCKL